LKDSIIHFGENLPQQALERAWEHARRSDLCIVFGSSLRVSPACDIPKETKKRGGKLVIVNYQSTPLDGRADIKIHAGTDDVCNRLRSLLAPERVAAATVHAPAAPNPLPVRYGNLHKAVERTDGNVHEWTVFVEEVRAKEAETTSYVKQVTYKLHPTFQPSVVTLDSAPFALSRVGWGTFNIGIEIVVVDRVTGKEAKHHFEHMLNFDQACSLTSVAC